MRIKSPSGNRKNERKEAIENDGRLSYTIAVPAPLPPHPKGWPISAEYADVVVQQERLGGVLVKTSKPEGELSPNKLTQHQSNTPLTSVVY